MSTEVILRRFGSEVEAALAVATLHANRIHSEVRSDSSSRGYHTSLAGPCIVVVEAKDVVRARQLLDTPFAPPTV
jgi:hypothetical protein